MYDIGIAANTSEQLIKNFRAVFKCIREAGLKLTIEKFPTPNSRLQNQNLRRARRQCQRDQR